MSRHPIPSDLQPKNIVAIIDTREGCPLDLGPLAVEMATLTTGDYSVKGLQHVVAIERKSLDDFLACVGRERERFDREVMRLLAYPSRCLVIEATREELYAGNWRSEVTVASVVGSIHAWQMMGLPVWPAGNHRQAGTDVARMLLLAARRRWRESRNLLAVLDEPKEETQDGNVH